MTGKNVTECTGGARAISRRRPARPLSHLLRSAAQRRAGDRDRLPGGRTAQGGAPGARHARGRRGGVGRLTKREAFRLAVWLLGPMGPEQTLKPPPAKRCRDAAHKILNRAARRIRSRCHCGGNAPAWSARLVPSSALNRPRRELSGANFIIAEHRSSPVALSTRGAICGCAKYRAGPGIERAGRENDLETRRSAFEPPARSEDGILAAGSAFLPRAGLAQTNDTPQRSALSARARSAARSVTLWVKAGHQVLFSSRHPEELKELVAGLGPRHAPARRKRRSRSATPSCLPFPTRPTRSSARITPRRLPARSCSMPAMRRSRATGRSSSRRRSRTGSA